MNGLITLVKVSSNILWGKRGNFPKNGSLGPQNLNLWEGRNTPDGSKYCWALLATELAQAIVQRNVCIKL